jgi:riboflavin kinase/FMN adenylyltransferase
MKVIYGISRIRKFRKSVVALGVFDGVHRGHRVILESAVRKTRNINGTSIVITFWPHPQKEESLYSLEHRLRLISELGIDVCIVINFNKQFAKIAAEDFIRNLLFKRLGADYLYVGKNFRFGKQAKGDFITLAKLSKTYKFKLRIFNVIKTGNRPISSTLIRRLITRGKLNTAQRLLGRRVSVLGTVIKGTAIGKTLGFPTANINPHHEVLPPSGVYAVKIIFNNRHLNGICYIGVKPTFRAQSAKRKAQSAKNIEVHVFNFNKNIYGKYLEIQFLKKIREERKFASVPLLAKQIKKDISFVKTLFSRHS